MAESTDFSAAEEKSLWHTRSSDEILQQLASDGKKGLSKSQVEKRQREWGPNLLVQARGRSVFSILIAQFTSLIVGLLVAATIVAFALGENVEGMAILAVIVINAAIGFATEWKAELTLSALEKQAVPTAEVLRDGHVREVPAAELVPGDIVLLAAGARIPADGRIVESVRLKVEEASLTGESVPAEKTADIIADDNAPLGDRDNMAYMGTAVADGRGKMIVTEIGGMTEIGRIGKMLDEAGNRDSPLDRKLSQLGRALIFIVLALSGVIVLLGWLQGHAFLHMLEVGISLAIAAVPEGLPAVATMTLALGMQRMARRRALVRRLSAVETLGSTTVICTDKTGTLTRNEMTVRAYQLGTRRVEVSGSGYDTEGKFTVEGKEIRAEADLHLRLALEIGALCNDALLDPGPPAHVHGDPTEGALVVAAEKAGISHTALAEERPRVSEQPFSSEMQRMVTVHRLPDNRQVAYIKGAPGKLIGACFFEWGEDGPKPLRDEDRDRLRRANDELAGAALRILALGYRELDADTAVEGAEENLVFVALVGMIDPLRKEAQEAIQVCRDAGIRVVMITGDQPATASEIGRQLGLDRSISGEVTKAVHGRELANLDEDAWRDVVQGATVFARVTPEHKLKIVEALQEQQEIVAMTGDGVNDAPALKAADIGVAMGVKGTEVAKEASAMIITDDNFATIVGAVEQGRLIYSNIIRFIHYLFSCNFSEILTVFIPILIGWPLPLVALQILWLNMITDVFPAMALALEPTAPGLMKRPPRDPRVPLLNFAFVWTIVWQASLLAAFTLLGFYMALQWHGETGAGLTKATTVAFMTLALAQVVHVFSARSQSRSAILSGLFSNAWIWAAVVVCVLLQTLAVYWAPLNRVLHTTPLSFEDWLLVTACSVAPAIIVEFVKFVWHLSHSKR